MVPLNFFNSEARDAESSMRLDREYHNQVTRYICY